MTGHCQTMWPQQDTFAGFLTDCACSLLLLSGLSSHIISALASVRRRLPSRQYEQSRSVCDAQHFHLHAGQ